MRLATLPLLVLCVLAGCSTPRGGEATVYTVSGHCEPWGIGDAYLTVVEVAVIAPDGSRTSTVMPRVVVAQGDTAEIALGNEDGTTDLSIQVTMAIRSPPDRLRIFQRWTRGCAGPSRRGPPCRP